MDPDATLESIAEALADEDREEAVYLLGELEAWLKKGGYAPGNKNLLASVRKRVRAKAKPAKTKGGSEDKVLAQIEREKRLIASMRGK